MKSIKDHYQDAKNKAESQGGELIFTLKLDDQLKTVKVNYSVKSQMGTTTHYSTEIAYSKDIEREMGADYPEYLI